MFAKNGTTPLASAAVALEKGGANTKTVYTSAAGAFSIGVLKPGTYTITVTKSGYSFANPAATVTVGPSSSGNVILAIGP